ncbi:hypothetical protein ACWGKQ_31530 [Streptomyces sp. NPDC054770]
MDYESAPVTGRADLELLVRDLALCLSVHRDKSPALVWPEGIDAVVAGAREVLSQGVVPGAQEPQRVSAGTAEVASALGELLGCEVDSSFIVLPTGAQHTGDTAKTDLVLLPVQGSCGGRVEPSAPGQDGAVLDHALELRLRVGEALYVPCGFVYTLNGVHAPCTLQVLALHPPVW